MERTPRSEPTGIGVDGCKAGWLFVELTGNEAVVGVVPILGDLLDRGSARFPIFVDIPIGLLEGGDRERLCDL